MSPPQREKFQSRSRRDCGNREAVSSRPSSPSLYCSRSRRDCGNREAEQSQQSSSRTRPAAVAATAAIVRR